MSFIDFAPLGALFAFGPLIVPAAWAFVAWCAAQEYRTRDARRELRAALDTKEPRS